MTQGWGGTYPTWQQPGQQVPSKCIVIVEIAGGRVQGSPMFKLIGLSCGGPFTLHMSLGYISHLPLAMLMGVMVQ